MDIRGVEIDMVVQDCLTALPLYESIFEVQRLEVTSGPVGQNEAVFTVYGTRFHLLDENPEFQLIAPQPGDPKPIWFNLVVPDIQAVHDKALQAGCTELQPVTELADFGVANSFFTDPFGYLWMLHEVHHEVSFEERERMLREMRGE